MEALKTHWQNLAAKLDGLQTRERALIVLSVLLVIYLVWDFSVFQPMANKREELQMRLRATQSELVKLSAEEQVFSQGLQNDPGAAKKREIVRLEQKLRQLESELRKLAVGLIAAEKLPQVLHDVLQKSHALKFVGMQTHPGELLSFDREMVASEQEAEPTEEAESVPERAVGVFKHAVTVSFEGNYFAVHDYLKSLEALDWKIYWDRLEYEVIRFPRAQVTLKVFTLSTEAGIPGSKDE